MNISSINFVNPSDITCGHRTVQDEVLGNDIFEVSHRRVTNLRIEVASLFIVLYLALAVSCFIFLRRLNQCDLMISGIVIMQAILVHYKVKLLTWLVHIENTIRRAVVSHSIFLFDVLKTKDVGDGAFIKPYVAVVV